MKKKAKKSSSKPRQRERNNELSELNSQLGSYGLEPPKRYRADQPELSAFSKSREQKQGRGKAEPQRGKTVQQKRAEQNKKRKKNKLLRKIIYTAVLILAVAAVIVILSLTVLFKITDITVSGNTVYTEEEIRAVLPIEENDNLFISDTKGAAEKLEQNLPYIYDAQIKRKFPSAISVEITETPIVYSFINEDESYTLVDDTFKVLETGVAEAPEGAVLISNAPITAATVGNPIQLGDEKQFENLKALSDAIQRLKLESITEIYSNDINNNFIVYDNRITFKLGTTENLDDKIYSALAAVEKLNESNPQIKGTITVTDGKQIYFTED